LPVSQARLDFCLNICLDLGPLLWFFWRVLGNQGAKITWFNGRNNALGGETVEVVDNY
jgi:hypothetical protein